MRNQFYAKSILWLLLLISVNAVSQESPQLLWSKSYESLRGYEITDTFGFDDDFFFLLRENRRKKYRYAFQKVSTDSLNVVGERIFNLPESDNSDLNIVSTATIGNKQYIIATAANNDNDTINIYAYEILETPSIETKPVLLAKADANALKTERNIVVFKDEKHELFSLIIPQETIPEKNEKYQLLLFNSRLEKVRSKLIEFPYPSEILQYTDALVDSTGAIYLLTSIINSKLTAINKDRNIGRDYSLFKFNWETETLAEKSLSLGVKWLYDVRLFINSDNNIQVAGYYSNMVDLIMAGTFSLELDRSSGNILNQGLNPFDRQFRSRFRPKGGNISETELGKFNLDYVFPKSDGSTQLISEKTFTETSTVFNPGTGTYSIITVYNYDEILISSIDPSSKINFNLMIPKYQSSTTSTDDYTSYLAFSESDKTIIVYNDNDRNANLGINDERGYRQLTSPSNSQAILVVIHTNGEVVKIPLYVSGKEKPVLNPSFFYQCSDGVVLVTNSGYEVRFVKVKLR